MKIGTVYDITFSTNRADTGAIANADSLPIVRVTENGVNLAYLPIVSSLSTGVYLVTIDASLANGFEVGKRYSVYVTATVNGINGANGLDSFTIETRGIDDVLPTASYSAPPSAAAIRTEVEGSTILAKETTVASRASQASVSAIPTNPLLTTDIRLDNLDAPISGAGGGSGGLTTEEHDKLMSLYNSGGGGVIDLTKKYEEIIEKYEKLMKDELKKIVESIPKIDISPVLTAISNIPVANLSDMTLALSALRGQIKLFNTTIKNDYISERNRIESEYAKEIDKKNSLLAENEYNLKQKEEKISSLTDSVESLHDIIEEMKGEHEEEMKMVDDTYSKELKKADDDSEEKMAEKFLSFIE